MTERLNDSRRAIPALFAMLVLWACSDGSNASGPPTGSTGGMPGVAGAAGTAGANSAGGQASSAAAGTPGAGGMSGKAGVTASAGGSIAGSPGSGGMTPATGGMSNTATGGAGATAGAAGAGGAAGGAAGASGAGGTTGSRPLSSTLKLPTKMETPGVAPFFHVWRPSDLAAVSGKLPVVVWNNGACNRNDQGFKPLFDKWSSGGYFVVSLTSGGGSSMTTQADQKALIDWVVAQDGMAGGPYNGKLDLTRIVAAGNSCGGITSLGLASSDNRVAAVYVHSGSSAMGSTMVSGIKVPVAYVEGGTEDISRANAEADYAAFAAGLPAMMVKRSSGDHLTISNDQTVMVDAADISVNWLDLTMFGLQGALDALKSPTVCTGCQAGLWTMTSKNLEKLVK